MSQMTEGEKKMAAIWAAALGQRIADPEADFLSLGGSSLLAAQVAVEASAKFGKHVNLVDVLLSTSLRELVSTIQHET